MINPYAPDGVYKPPHVYCRMGFINISPISHVAFEQKRGKSVWVIENKWSAYGKTILSRIHS